jgi:hypothetical protein
MRTGTRSQSELRVSDISVKSQAVLFRNNNLDTV